MWLTFLYPPHGQPADPPAYTTDGHASGSNASQSYGTVPISNNHGQSGWEELNEHANSQQGNGWPAGFLSSKVGKAVMCCVLPTVPALCAAQLEAAPTMHVCVVPL